MPKLIKHILVIRLSAMGDVAMTIPVLRAFTEQYPNVKLTVLTRSFFAPFFRNLPNVTVFAAEVDGKHKSVSGLYKLSKELKNLNIDAVADVHNVLRSSILKLFLLGIKTIQIDKGRAEKKALTTGKIFHQLKTTQQRYADVFDKLGFPINLSQPKFPEPIKLNDKLVSIIGNDTKKIIGIAPFAAFEGKMYPLDLMEEVIKTLSNTHKILLFGGGKKEVKQLNTLENKYDNVINLAGKLSLNDELDIISNIDVMLSMDSGNAHIAAMLGKKVVTLWGVTHPFAGFTPFNQPDDFALLSDRNKFPLIPTSVYGNKCPETYKDVMKTIEPKTVVKKIEQLL